MDESEQPRFWFWKPCHCRLKLMFALLVSYMFTCSISIEIHCSDGILLHDYCHEQMSRLSQLLPTEL